MFVKCSSSGWDHLYYGWVRVDSLSSLSLTIVESCLSFSGGDLAALRNCNHRVLCLFDTHSFCIRRIPFHNIRDFYIFFSIFLFEKRNITEILRSWTFFTWILKHQQQQQESIFFLSELCWLCETKVVSKQLKLQRMLAGQNGEMERLKWMNKSKDIAQR